MNLDAEMSGKAVQLRKATQKLMAENYDAVLAHVEDTTFPHWITPKLRDIGINGLHIEGYGSPALNHFESGSIIYELAKSDGSIAMYFLVQNCLGLAVIDALGS
jgi:alkylation response protein AidB-like acyl-CoA dehydrogenase